MAAGALELRDPGTAPGPALLRVKRVSVTFRRLPVLDDVDFEVGPGQLVALIGENGAGKSTLVRCIAGDVTPNLGEVHIGGSKVRTNGRGASKGLAVVWQDGAFCDNLDVSANLFLGREPGRWFVSDQRERAATRRILSSYGINLSGDRSMGVLSGGQRQLVAVARAMQSQPRLLVLDEPTASLGVLETKQVEDLIAKVKAEGTTILLISHDVEQVFNLADRILVLRRGRVVADLVPSESHPDDVIAIMSGHEPEVTAAPADPPPEPGRPTGLGSAQLEPPARHLSPGRRHSHATALHPLPGRPVTALRDVGRVPARAAGGSGDGPRRTRGGANGDGGGQRSGGYRRRH